MRKAIISVLTMCSFVDCFGQDYHTIDSLKRVLNTTKEDTLKGLAIWSLVDEYMWTRPDSGLYFANTGLTFIKDARVKNEFEKSKNHILYSFEIRMYAKGAIAGSLQRNDSLALKWAFKALQMAEKSKDKFDIPRVYANLSNVYHEIGEPRMAINYMKKAMLLNTTLSEDIQNYNLGAIGEYYYELCHFDSALWYINKIYD